jgi:tRNA (guanine37-N1)-methyltransferase
MRFDVLTIFPGYFVSPLGEALVGKAIEDGLLDVRLVDLRPFSEDPHRKVDDEAFGGGPGMVLSAPPLFAAIEALRAVEGAPPPHVIYLSPRGRRLDAALARELATRPRLVLVCGRYEGVDERAREGGLFDAEVSLGDFVLSGGEAAALALLEAVSRFVPGVVGEADSVRLDSFEDGLLDYPHYTRPREVRGLGVPDALLSGHHERIRRWRREKQFEETARYRPDLLARFVPATDEDRDLLARVAGKPRTP